MWLIMAQVVEFIFSFFLCICMKVGREEIKLSGKFLRQAYRLEKNLLYNYEFGKYTKHLRVWLLIFFLPSLYKRIINIKSSYNSYHLMLIIADILTLVDQINTTESYHRYCLIYSIRLFRTAVLLFELVQEITKYFVASYMNQLKHQQQYQNQQDQISSLQQQQYNSIQQEEMENEELQKFNANKKQQQQNQTIKRLVFPQMKIPCICLNLSINYKHYQIQIIDPWSYEQSFYKIPIRDQLLQMVKLNYACQIYQRLKNQKCNQQALNKYREQIAEYFSQLIIVI